MVMASHLFDPGFLPHFVALHKAPQKEEPRFAVSCYAVVDNMLFDAILHTFAEGGRSVQWTKTGRAADDGNRKGSRSLARSRP
jgi:hypothetical protein